jgi:hypothetical protein
MADLSGLSIDGRVATADDSDWDEARQAWNLIADQNPVAVAFAAGPDDVSAVVRFAADNDLRVTAQGTGHGAAALGPLDDTILIKTTRMRGIEIDADAGTARVEAGVEGSELGEAAHAHGMCSMPGTSPNVGVIGYTLGGGLSWLGRKYGFACNRVRAIEAVTADGEPRRIDADAEPDLFWAMRGGGGSFAIVTALEVDLVPVSEAYAGALLFPAELGAEAVRAYRDWADEAPEEVTSIVRFLRPPPIPEVPEPIRDKPLLTIDATFIGDKASGEGLIAPLRALGEPIIDTFDQIPTAALSRIHMDPEPPVPGMGHHGLVRELPDDAVDAFFGVAGPEANPPFLLAELRHLGGALCRPAADGGALSMLDAEYAMFAIGMPMTPELGAALPSALDALVGAMEPWAAGGGYLNFAERPCDVDAIMPAETCDRLTEIKRTWDPDAVIVANHAVALTPA